MSAMKIIHVSTNVERTCEVCRAQLPHGDGYFAAAVNHYLSEHEADLKHTGQETSHADNGLWHSTVAVLAVDG